MTDEVHVALFSGGQNSAVATHAAMRFGPCEAVVYLDTGTGSRRNREYIERFADEYNWHLITWRTPENYDELVRKYGFPGPSKHMWFYRYLKERQVRKFAGFVDELHCWTGVFRAESSNRMQRVVERDDDGSGQWVWHAPLADWESEDFRRYLDRFNLPRNPLWRTIGRSGDCYCGAYANRMELIDAEACGCGDVVDNIRGIESDIDRDDPRDEWAWHDDEPSAWAIENPDQMSLCGYCEPPSEMVDDARPDGGEKDSAGGDDQ